jgi:magnesium chelatase family protein
MGITLPAARITVNLSPSALPKYGSGYDLPIAIAVLSAVGELDQGRVTDNVHIGELGLNGAIRKVSGILPMLWVARDAGVSRAVIPAPNLAEAQLVSGIHSRSVASLGEALALHGSARRFPDFVPDSEFVSPIGAADVVTDFSQIIGQEGEMLAMALAAAGGHNLALVGPPGTGKTMLAERMVTIMPPLQDDEALLLGAIESLVGKFSGQLNFRPRLQSPHHSVSLAALIGGGTGSPKPGAITRSHLGVLFLDEATEFPNRHLDALRQPIEAGFIEIGRVHGVVRYPSRFQLILAFNPCPCGNYASSRTACRCGSAPRIRYLNRISGPLFDRLDIRLWVEPPDLSRTALSDLKSESSMQIQQRVQNARELARARLAPLGLRSNAELSLEQLRRDFALDSELVRPLLSSLERGQISMRGLVRILRLAWTCADYFGETKPSPHSLDMAIALHSDPLTRESK